MRLSMNTFHRAGCNRPELRRRPATRSNVRIPGVERWYLRNPRSYVTPMPEIAGWLRF